MKTNIFKKLGFTFLAMIIALCGLFSISNAIFTNKSANATFEATQVVDEANTEMPNTKMFFCYADDTLVAIDQDGYVYTSLNGTAPLTKNGNQLSWNLWQTAGAESNSTNYYGTGTRLVYANNLLLFLGDNGTNIIAYTSTNKGLTWDSANTTGFPANAHVITVVYGNGIFVANVTNPSVSNNPCYTNLYKSTDGKNWSATNQQNMTLATTPDASMIFSNGYFIRTEYYSPNDSNVTPIICRSQNLETWETLAAPEQVVVENGGYSNPRVTPFMIGTSLYAFGFHALYVTENFQTWRKVCDMSGTIPIKAISFQNGVLFCYSDGISYREISSTGLTNYKGLIGDNWSNAGSYIQYETRYATVATWNDDYLCVAFPGMYGAQTNFASAYAVWERTQYYTVDFLDYNGNLIQSFSVSDGSTVTAPTNPTRTGYTFAGWDRDLTLPITADTTITATYTANLYTVTFMDYNGTTISTVQVPYDTYIQASDIPTPVSSRPGYQFAGWSGDLNQKITSNVTFTAQYTQTATLTVKYPAVIGTFGLDGQFNKTEQRTATFNYTIGDVIKNSTYNSWYEQNITPLVEDFNDGYYDYDVKITGFSLNLPTTIQEDITLEINYVKLINVALNYYSQLRFQIQDDYYYTFVGYMTIERLVEKGYVINLDYFKRADLNYYIYNANRNEYYDNLAHFEFLGWDKDITQPLMQDTTIKGKYKLPSVHMRMFDAEDYLVLEKDQEISFLTIEDLLVTFSTFSDAWDTFQEMLRNFLHWRWGEIVSNIANQLDWSTYIQTVRRYHSMSTQILTGFIQFDTNNPDVYGGIFNGGAVNVDGAALKYYSGTASSNNLTYYIGAEAFISELISLNVTVTYKAVLDSVIKTVKNIFAPIASWISKNWVWIVIVVLVIVFHKPIIEAVTFIVRRIKAKVKKSDYAKAKQEYKTAKKSKKSTYNNKKWRKK